MTSIRDIFSTRRPIDRRIEKVIDYYADSEDRLAAEIEEYEATDSLEACFRKFLETYQSGVQLGQVTEIGMWVAGFYGSGKSSFTKYLGFALDPNRKIQGRPFLDHLCDRLRSSEVKALLRTTAQRYPTAVVLLDLGAEQLAESTAATVTNVLYWKNLNLSGYSKEKKLAQLELTLEEKAKYDEFQKAYQEAYGGTWKEIHNDPLLGVSRASKLIPQFLPGDFTDKDSFSKLRFEMADDVRDIARRMISVVRHATGCENILFLIDEAGQYVAPRSELILNLDGLARNFKELGKGKVWIVCTGQQTLTEIVERAAINSPELNRMRDRFPISIELDARDIREITYRRLLAKSSEGETQLKALFQNKGQATIQHTRLSTTSFYKSDPTINDFVRYYPFLPQHFEILMELIRVLARSTGGIGLRSAIRVMQDILVDTSRILPADATRLADRPLGCLACADDFYSTLRADINKSWPNVVAGVDKVERIFGKGLHLRVAKAIGALQPLENFNRTTENIAALLYPEVGGPTNLESVRQALTDIIANKDIGLVEDPQVGGYLFLSESVTPYRKKRTDYVPPSGEINRIRNEILKKLLEPQPSTRLENVKDIRAAVRMQTTLLLGDQEEISFRLEMAPASLWEDRRKTLLTQTSQNRDEESTVVWLFQQDETAEDILPEIRKSEKIVGDIDERGADRDVAQYIRSERRLAERNREIVEGRLREALLSGIFIFRGRPTPVRQISDSLETSTRSILTTVAAEVFHQYHLVKIRPETDLAAKFLEVERLDRMPRDRDPLNLVIVQSGMPRIQINHPALAETLRAFRARVQDSGGGRLSGKAIQDYFAAAPYGWSKDAVRYLFAAALIAGEIELHTGGEVLKTAGPAAAEALRSTVAFNRIGVGLRDTQIGLETLDRAAQRLQSLFGEMVLPLEDHISRAARKYLPLFTERYSSLPATLRLLGLPGESRAAELLTQITDILRGDASDAPSRLGVPETDLVDDIRWGRTVADALSDGGEQDVQSARALISQLKDLEQLFPGPMNSLDVTSLLELLEPAFISENIHEQLPNLRTGMQKVRGRVRIRYGERIHDFREALKNARDALERMGEWSLIAEEDRQDILSELPEDLPDAPSDAIVVSQYKSFLAHLYRIPVILPGLQESVINRLPVVEETEGNGETINGDKEEVIVEVARPTGAIENVNDLNRWLEQLRAELSELLKNKKRIRIK